MKFNLRFKRLLCSFSVVVLAFLGASTVASAKLKVVTTFTILQDMAQNVAGDAADVVSITKPGAEIHDYQPTPQDIAKAYDANLILYNGFHLERWFEKFLSNLPKVPSVVATDGIEPMPIKEGEYEGYPNPHAWMSPSNAKVYIENIRRALVKADPANAETYNRNAANYLKKIEDLDAPLRAKLLSIPADKRWLVTSEGAFSYLARDYDMKEAYLWPVNAEEEGTPQQIKRVVDIVKKNHIPVVFSESTVSDKPAKQLSKETGAKYGGVLYVDSLSEPSGPVPTYIDLLKVTVNRVVKGFDK